MGRNKNSTEELESAALPAPGLLRFATSLVQFSATVEFDLTGVLGGGFPPVREGPPNRNKSKKLRQMFWIQRLTLENAEMVHSSSFGRLLALIGARGGCDERPGARCSPRPKPLRV